VPNFNPTVFPDKSSHNLDIAQFCLIESSISFVSASTIRHHVPMSKSKIENRYWASDFDSQCGSLALQKIKRTASTTKSHNK
jgi:hypothetical protein